MWRADVTSNRLRAPRAVRIRSVSTAFSRVVRERASTRIAVRGTPHSTSSAESRGGRSPPRRRRPGPSSGRGHEGGCEELVGHGPIILHGFVATGDARNVTVASGFAVGTADLVIDVTGWWRGRGGRAQQR